MSARRRVRKYITVGILAMAVFLTVELLAFYVFSDLVLGAFFAGLLLGSGGAIAAVVTYVIGTRKL